jgi:hypothetical protein
MSLFISERRRKQSPRLPAVLKVTILFMLAVGIAAAVYLLM